MAVTVSATQLSTNTTANPHSFSFTATASQPYALRLHVNANLLVAPVTVAYNGSSMTSAGTEAGPGVSDACYIFIRSDGTGADGGAHNMVITYADTPSQSHALANSFAGAHASAPFSDYATNTGTSTTASVDVPNLASGDLAIAVAATLNDPTADAGQTDEGEGSNGGHFGAFSRETGTGTVTLQWAMVGVDLWEVSGLRVVQAAGGGGAAKPRLDSLPLMGA